MRRSKVLQELQTMRVVELYGSWQECRLTQEEASLHA